MKKYLIANWKCNITANELKNYFVSFKNLDCGDIKIAFAVPSIFLLQAKQLTSLPIIAQDIEYFKYGSHTGRISYEHLLDNNIQGTIIGHSEQRVFNDNTDEIINEKVKVALNHQMQVFLCIGEPLEIYQNKETKNFLKRQLEIALKGVDINHVKDQLIIAYEPIWAIGTGKIPSCEEIQDIIQFIKSQYNLDVLYGGSVNEDNIEALKKIDNINGFLIGSASYQPQKFINLLFKYKK